MTDYNDDHQDTSEKPGPMNLQQENLQQDSQQDSSGRTTPALIEKFVIRLPKGLRKKIKHLSEQNRRSMNSEIIMVLEKHIQQHLNEAAGEFSGEQASVEYVAENSGIQKLSDSELTRRLESLPEEKKQALLELLG